LPILERLSLSLKALAAAAGFALGCGVLVAGDLPADFVTPPAAARPWVNLWWFAKVTPADITQHLEQLQAKGVGGVMLIDLGNMPGAPYMSDKWRELFRHAVREADRLGLKLGVNTCPGWPAGGPWTTPENSSWTTVSSETVLQGPQKFSGKLVDPKGRGALYAEVAVQAFPMPQETAKLPPVVTASANPADLPHLLDGNFNTVWKSGADEKPWILVDFGRLQRVDWTWIDLVGKVVIEASNDGVTFNPVATLNGPPHNTIYEAVPATTARWFRLVVPRNATVRDFALGTRAEVERVALLAAKRAGSHPLGVTATRQADQVRLVREELVALPDDRPLAIGDRIDLTRRVSKDGTLHWDVPPGTWKVVRIGRTTTGLNVAFGKGLLVDYLSPAAMTQHYEKGIKPVVGDAGALVGKTFLYSIEDNVEIDGIYSWTPRLLDEFQKRRGYNPTPYLATMAGEIVGNVQITDRFLADVRRTIADCVADGHYGRWAQLAHADGLQVRAEAGGQHHPRLLCNDGLMNQGRMDVPVAEFWEIELWKENQWAPADHHAVTTPGWDEAAQNVNAKQAASAGHLYGKRVVASEAWTTGGRRQHWGTPPAGLLRHANTAFCEGINALSIHGSATSGPEDGLPGKSVFGGSHFNHNITWWNQGAEEFLRYMTRCSHLLRQGLYVADVLYYNGDEAPNFVPPKNIDPSRGFGYDYDVCNTEVLLTRLSVQQGRIVLPDGMSYRVLVLPERPVMPLSAARKIQELVAAGATVIGPKPQRTPGLAGYPRSEHQLKQIADKVWGAEADAPATGRSYGKGRVVCGPSIREVLAQAAVPPDFACQSQTQAALVDFIHRRTEDAEIYFVANRRGASLQADCTFRVGGPQPELWDPVTGAQRDLPQFEIKGGCTSVPLEFEPYGALFVVFRKGSPKSEVRTPKPPAGSQPRAEENFPRLTPAQELAGPWTVQFDPQWFYPTNDLGGEQARGLVSFEKLEDWNQRAEPAVKYFSGSAVYRKVFELAPELRRQKSEISKTNSNLRPPTADLSSRLFLDLGTVKETARVRLNGKDLGVVWCPPWRVEITGAAQPGANALEIAVVNLWPNRLMGDRKLPPAQRRTRTRMFMGGLNDEQQSAGLLGPVTIQAIRPGSAQ
jgi:hypothetical protein